MSLLMKRWIGVCIVAVHLLLLAAYTLPQQLVPDRVRWSAAFYSRALFHQQWDLFAPDPPLCACEVQVGTSAGAWQPVIRPDGHYLERRMARPLADHVQTQVLLGDSVLLPILEQALVAMVRHGEHEVDELQFRLVEDCVHDPKRPELRTERITPLRLSRP